VLSLISSQSCQVEHPEVISKQETQPVASVVDGDHEQQYQEVLQVLEPCPFCGRKFHPDRLDKHINVSDFDSD
jgi:hypothetical protein